jgi:hypothetical protein
VTGVDVKPEPTAAEVVEVDAVAELSPDDDPLVPVAVVEVVARVRVLAAAAWTWATAK